MNAYIILSIAALTVGAVYQDVLCRLHGSTDDWIVMGQPRNTAATTFRVPDLQPGKEYDFVLRAASFNGTPSAVSTALTRTAPGNTTAPTTPSGVAVDTAYTHVDAKLTSGTGKYSLMGVEVKWDLPVEADIAYVRVEWTSNNSAPLMGMAITDNAGPGIQRVPKDQNWAVIYKTLLGADGYAQVYFVNTSGTVSARGSVSLSGSFFKVAGSAAAQDVDAMEISGVQLGDTAASSVQKVLASYPVNTTVSITGGSPTETYDLSLSNRGFGTKPDVGTVQCLSDDTTLIRYDYDSASSTSTNARLVFSDKDGANLSSGSYRISGTFTEYD